MQDNPGAAIVTAFGFVRQSWARFLAISAAVLVPCWWQRHIEAGDLGSHVYNAWLAQLIEKGQAPGLYFARQWTNVFFDVLLVKLGNFFGLAIGEKIAVSICVLVFFWGVFAFLSAVSGRMPWMVVPVIAMLAYGYSFQMGFMNYYVSIGFACFGLALIWRGVSALDVAVAGAFALLAFVAQPMGALFFAAIASYRGLRALPGWWQAIAPVSAAGVLLAVHWYLAHRWRLEIDWATRPFYQMNGADQVVVYGHGDFWVAVALLSLAIIGIVAEALERRGDLKWWKEVAPLAELYGLAILAAALLPENLRSGMYAGWIGLIVSRLTTITAIFALCVLSFVRARRFLFAGFAALAGVYFVLLFQEERWLNGMEANAEGLLWKQPYGTRITHNVGAPRGWRSPFLGHLVDRACVGHCFVYSNYEAPTQQFRIRVAAGGSAIVTSSEDDSEDMEAGTYEVQDSDPPLTLIYQCEPRDLRVLCAHKLAEGDTTDGSKYAPGARTSEVSP